MNKKIIIGIIVVAVLGAIMIITKNNKQSGASVAGETADRIKAPSVKNSVDKIEVYYFHRTQRCYSCNTLSQYAKETIEQKFSEEIKNGKIEFREMNVDLPENKDTVLKFQASGSALFINAIKDRQDDINQDTNVWRLLNNKPQFENYLTNKISSLLEK